MLSGRIGASAGQPIRLLLRAIQTKAIARPRGFAGSFKSIDSSGVGAAFVRAKAAGEALRYELTLDRLDGVVEPVFAPADSEVRRRKDACQLPTPHGAQRFLLEAIGNASGIEDSAGIW